MKYDIQNGKLLMCIPTYKDEIRETDSGRIRIATQEIDITLPEGIKKISRDAFDQIGSYVERIHISKGVKTLPAGVFLKCYALQEVIIDDGPELINAGVFSKHKSIKRVSLPSSVRAIGPSAFIDSKSLETIGLSEGLCSIGYKAFFGCSNLRNIRFPESLTKLGALAFFDTPLRISIPDNMEYMKTSIGVFPDGSPILWDVLYRGDTEDGHGRLQMCDNVLDHFSDLSEDDINNDIKIDEWIRDVFYAGALTEEERKHIWFYRRRDWKSNQVIEIYKSPKAQKEGKIKPIFETGPEHLFYAVRESNICLVERTEINKWKNDRYSIE